MFQFNYKIKMKSCLYTYSAKHVAAQVVAVSKLWKQVQHNANFGGDSSSHKEIICWKPQQGYGS